MATLAEMLVQNALSNQDVSKGPDIAGSLQKGAQIAQQQQDLNMRKQQIQMQMQQVHDTKLEKFALAVEKGQALSGKAQTNYQNKYLPQYRDALGLTKDISDDALQMTTAPENQYVFDALRSEVTRGTKTGTQVFQIMSDPQQMIDYAQTNKLPFTAKEGGFTMLNQQQRDAINADEKSAEVNKATVGKQEKQFGQEDKRDYNTFAGDINKQIRSDFKPLQDKQTALREALSAGARVQNSLKNGEKPSAQDAKVIALTLLRGEVGRVNEAEIAAYTGQPGILGWSEDKMIKYLTGGANAETVGNLVKVAQTSAQHLDQQMGSLRQSFESQVANSAYAGKRAQILAPLNAVAVPTAPLKKKSAAPPIEAPAGTGATIDLNGQKIPVEQAQAYLKAHPDGKDAPAIKRLLGAE